MILVMVIEMSFEKSYIRTLSQKYRLAVAIAVIKKKPENLSIEKYIEELKSKINNDSVDDLDITVCSDDFDLEDSDENINQSNNNYLDRPYNETTAEIQTTPSSSRLFNENDRLFNQVTNDENRDSDEIRQDVTFASQNTTYSQESESLLNNLNIAHMSNGGNSKVLNNSSKIPDKHMNAKSHTPQQTAQKSLEFDSITQTRINMEHDYHIAQNVMRNITKDTPNITNQTTMNEADFRPGEVVCQVINSNDNIPETFYDSQATILYSIQGFTDNYTHVSQTQDVSQIVLEEKFIRTKNNVVNSTKQMEIDNNASVHRKDNFSKIVKDSVLRNGNENWKKNPVENLYIEDMDDNVNLENEISINHNSQSNLSLVNQNSMETNEAFPQYAQNLNSTKIYEHITMETGSIANIDENRHIEIDEEEICSTETEIVSFKVIEELNKVRNYINRRIDRRISNDGSMDSGYKSDSQKSSLRCSLQLSGNWLNQSAHSLYEYITQCPLMAATHEIVIEIAQVFGQLIDRLHEEEKYPSFLEVLLENVDGLLQDILHGNSGEDQLLIKDETIQRLFLINKSTHIQKYTIDKIATILEDLHTNLSNPEELYEITHTNEMENFSYIFHILEVLLKKFSKEKFVSQETNSQNEIKKSSIEDIWRKKWNPKFKEDDVINEIPQKCVLLKCNEVLNKLVVTCMEGYSLIAFCALQCFNILQY